MFTFVSFCETDVPSIREHENETIKGELGEKPTVAVITDATGGKDEFTVVCGRWVYDPPDSEDIWIVQRILEVLLTKGHHDAMSAAGSLFKVLINFGISPDNVLGHMRDTVAMNTKMDTILRQIGSFDSLISMLCLGHLSSNAGGELFKGGRLAVLVLFWRVLQNVLRSSQARELWASRTGKLPQSYSEIKWWCKFECVEDFRVKFSEMLPWAMEVMESGLAPESAPRLVNLLTSPGLVHYLKIDMAAYCFIGAPMHHVAYGLEGDGELVFRTYSLLEEVIVPFEFGIPSMTEVRSLAADAVAWALTEEGVTDLALSASECDAARTAATLGPPMIPLPPRPQRNLTGIAAATRARIVAADLMTRAAQQAALDRAKELAEEAHVKALVAAPPRTVNGWDIYAQAQIAPAIDYYFRRLRDEDEYGPQMLIFEAASIFLPRTLAVLDLTVARIRLGKIRTVTALDNDTTFEALSHELPRLKLAAEEWLRLNEFYANDTVVDVRRDSRLQKRTKGKIIEFDPTARIYVIEFKLDNAVVQERIDVSLVDMPSFSVLSYLKQRRLRFPAFFAASKILALYQPTSAAAERVFSLLEQFFGKKGSRGNALSDLIDGTLKLNYHKRRA